MTIRIGTAPYLDAKPLTRWFSHTEEGKESQIEVVYALPYQLARMLAEGEIAAALVSSFEYFRTPGYVISPDISISGQAEIESIRAFARASWRNIESLALDPSALTSVALLKILLAEQLNSYPAFLQTAQGLEAMLSQADACLLTGDAGLTADGTDLNVLDLGHAWRLTGLPFVYALWLGKPERLTPQLIDALTTAKAWGLTQLDAIAEEEATRLGISFRKCRRYLTETMDYDFGEEHYQALETFGAKAYSQQLLIGPPSLLRMV
ncbi:MAG: menaquinone biosynthetic enzyme MqnA/MqnD family protein [Janthinobacterium lividum]